MDIKIKVLQFLNEHGYVLPIYSSKSKCQDLWKSQTNNVKCTGNRPIEYATKSTSIVDFMISIWGENVGLNDRILEVGSNCGANLNRLAKLGFSNLSGIEINKNAIDEMKSSFPKLDTKIYNNSIENILSTIQDNSYEVIFSMAVLLHIHPKSNFVFKEMIRTSKKYICTIEAEKYNCNYVFPRNYKRVFERLGCNQIKEFYIDKHSFPEIAGDYYGYTARFFEVRK